jgi:hypothetical protein
MTFREALAAAGSMSALADRLRPIGAPAPAWSGPGHWLPDDLIDRFIEEAMQRCA